MTLSDAEKAAIDQRTMQQSLEIIRRRVDEAGTREPSIQRQGADRILVQVPGVGSAEELLADHRQDRAAVVPPGRARARSDANAEPGLDQFVRAVEDETGVFYVLDKRSVVTGEQLVDSQPSFDQNGRPAVTFRFNPSGGAAFGDYTAANIGKPFAIVLDNQVISAPMIQAHIAGGSGIITGSFTPEEFDAARDPAPRRRAAGRDQGARAAHDRAGARAGLDQRRRRLGRGRLRRGHRLHGAELRLVRLDRRSWRSSINLTLIIAAMTLIGATLTMPGIAGIVLTIGMAVDSNVLIFERIREELQHRARAGAGDRPRLRAGAVARSSTPTSPR